MQRCALAYTDHYNGERGDLCLLFLASAGVLDGRGKEMRWEVGVHRDMWVGSRRRRWYSMICWSPTCSLGVVQIQIDPLRLLQPSVREREWVPFPIVAQKQAQSCAGYRAIPTTLNLPRAFNKSKKRLNLAVQEVDVSLFHLFYQLGF